MRRTTSIEQISAYLLLLAGWIATAILLASCGGGSSAPVPPMQPTLVLSSSPNTISAYASTSFSISITAVTKGTTTIPAVTIESLPAGLTSSTSFPLSIPSGGATISFAADATLAAGSYSIVLDGKAGTATDTIRVALTVQTGPPPGFIFVAPQSVELTVPIGGSAQMQFGTRISASASAQVTYQISLSANGLPSGTTATFTPQTIVVGQNANLTVSASNNAPISYNAQVIVTGTPMAAVSSSSVGLLADITPAPGNIPNSRTDYLSTEGTPNSAVYDPVHNLIFSSNPAWNRIDVISNATHTIVNNVPIRDPRGLDISIDGSTIWAATGSQQMFAINTSTLRATRYLLPQLPSGAGTVPWEGMRVFALADGTVLLLGGNTLYVAVWDPGSNTLTPLDAPRGVQCDYGYMARSGDGKRVYGISAYSDGQAFY